MADKITIDPTTPQDLQEEINHTKTETGAMAMVQEHWEKGMRKMQPYHRQWFLNIAYLLGFQHLVWHPSKNRLWLPPARRRQVRMTSNLMMSSYRINLSKLSTGSTPITVLPNSNEQEDVDAARLAQKVWFHISNESEWTKKRRRLVGWILSTGNGFISIEWNPNTGEMLSQPIEEEKQVIQLDQNGDQIIDEEGNPVSEIQKEIVGVEQYRSGKVSIKPLSPFSVVTIGSGTELEDCDAVVVGEWLSLEEIRRQFPEKGKYVTPEFRDDASTFEKFLDGLVSPTTSQVNPQSGGEPSERGAVVKRYWQKSSPEFPAGRLIICANNVMLFMGENPTPKDVNGDISIPIVHFREIDVPFRFWGRSSIEDQIPDQKAYNKALSIILEHHSLFKGKWIVPRGAQLKESNLDSSADEVVEAIPIGGVMPYMANIKPPQLTLFRVLEQHRQNMMEQSGVREVSRGELPTGARSGYAIQLLQESDTTQAGTTRFDIFEKNARVASLCLLIAAERMVVPQKIRIIGKNSEVDIIENFTGDMLRNNTQVIVAGTVGAPFSLVARKAEIMDMQERGAFVNPETGQTDWRTVMELLEFGQTQDVFSEQALDESQAETENREMVSGIMPMAKRYQDHQLHVKIHNRRRKAPEYIEMAKEKPEMDLVFEQHLQQHGAFLTEQIRAATIAQMGGQQQGGSIQQEVQNDQTVNQGGQNAR